MMRDRFEGNGGLDPLGSFWRRSAERIGLVLVLLLAVCLIYYDTLGSMVGTWSRSGNFAHGFLIAPISLWLIWEKRDGLAKCRIDGAWLPVLLMIPAGISWGLGSLVGALVVQQFAFVAIVILAVWSVIGTPMARLLVFPLGFLFFAVPVGEGLVYPLMTFTADFTVSMLRLTGIPVYREGTLFSIPSGDWSVVEACSGVRYLTASVTLGALYAYLTYTRLWKRLLFVAFAVVVPIVANGFRAYFIVMIGHLSNMRLAVGIDHFIYGWVFFGVIVFVMFFVGSFWRDNPAEGIVRSSVDREAVGNRFLTGIAALLIAAAGPVLVAGGNPVGDGRADYHLVLPAAVDGWVAEGRNLWAWRPRVVGVDAQVYGTYRRSEGPVGLFIGFYGQQEQGAEVVSSENRILLEKDPIWREVARKTFSVSVPGGELEVRQHLINSSGGERLLVWNWVQVGRWEGINPYLAKLFEAWSRLSALRRDGAYIAVATPYGQTPEEAEKYLAGFVIDFHREIRASVDAAAGRR